MVSHGQQEDIGDERGRRAKLLRDGNAEELRDDRHFGSVDLTHWYTPAGRALSTRARRVSASVGARGSLIMTLVIGGVVASPLSLVASGIYDAVSQSESVAGLDKPILAAAITMRSPQRSG
jgi:hypothetical protein